MKRAIKKGTEVGALTGFSKKLPHLQMPPFSHKPSSYTGPSYQEVLKMRKENISASTFAFYKQPVMVVEGRMQYLYDHTGRRYLDMFAGIATSGLGHCHPRITAKLHEQVDKLLHCSTIYLHDQMGLYAKELTDKLPDNIDSVCFSSSGSEANLMATQFAR